MKKNIFKILLILFISILFVPNIKASYASIDKVNKKVKKEFGKEATYYCKYNMSGQDNGKYDIIVGITSDNKNAYADTNFAYTEPIRNWISTDSNYDTGSPFEAYSIFINTGCPKFAYDHYVIGTHNIYLYNFDNYTELIKSFSVDVAQQNEDVYTLVNSKTSTENFSAGVDTEFDKSCDYTVKDAENKFEQSISLKYNKSGLIINLAELKGRITISHEGSMAATYLGEKCPNLIACKVPGKVYSGAGGSGTVETDYKLYYSDFASDGHKASECDIPVKCTNTNDNYCDPESVEANVCPLYTNLKMQMDNLFSDFSNCKNDSCKRSTTNIYIEIKSKMTQWCKLVFNNMNFSNSCLKRCLNFKDDPNIKKYDSEILSKKNEIQVCGLSERLIVLIRKVIKWVKYIIPVIVIILGLLDFIKAVGTDKDEEMKKAQGKFVKRLIAAALIFIVPLILGFVLDKMGFVPEGCEIIDI